MAAAIENLGYAGLAGSRYAPGSPWLYVLADMPRDSQVRRSAGKRARSGFSVIPAVEVLQRNAYSNYLQHVAHSNRDFLNCIGKRDVLSCLANVRGGALKEWRGRSKRRMPSLSIDLPMAVLRQKLSLEQSRHDHAVQAAANRNFLNDIGKRGLQWDSSLDSQKFY
ncbi:hypothetical protein MSG28_000404 [Choristoneura fumiferana]|uniref:Uncharacterized protein n=1 Tax=Choristoneura fumiferana TaxID=7141 RepID=A0ACC0K0Q1_CHOFU|nr:hypothetical protein MSG28_000404 [Choristoneura fumiferana]